MVRPVIEEILKHLAPRSAAAAALAADARAGAASSELKAYRQARAAALEIGKAPLSAHRFANAALNWLAAIDAVTGFCRNSRP